MSGIELIPCGARRGFEVPLGQTIIGRGPFLQIVDKRISRKHAMVEVDKTGSLQITPCSTNTNETKPSVKVTRRLPDWMLRSTDKQTVSTSKKSPQKETSVTEKAEDENVSASVDDEKLATRKRHTDDDDCDDGVKHSIDCPQKTKYVKLDEHLSDEAADDHGENMKDKDLDVMGLPQKSEENENKADNRPEEDVNNGLDGDNDSTRTVQNTQRRYRRSCRYGTKCYRKNPVHFAEFSHPGDESYDDGSSDESEQKVKPALRAKDSRSLLAGDDDDDGEANTYDYNDSFLNDDDAAGSESTDSHLESEQDSDWEPDEDINELVTEASEFKRNKRMQQTT